MLTHAKLEEDLGYWRTALADAKETIRIATPIIEALEAAARKPVIAREPEQLVVDWSAKDPREAIEPTRLEPIEEPAAPSDIPPPKQRRDRLLSQPSAAAYLGVCHETMSNWRKSGKGPKFETKRGRAWYRLSELDPWGIPKYRSAPGPVRRRQGIRP